jgi:peptidoglycan hydrolase CwlO-like protein
VRCASTVYVVSVPAKKSLFATRGTTTRVNKTTTAGNETIIRMHRERWLFIFAAIQAVGALVAILAYFGISSERLKIQITLTALPSVWWLIGAVMLFLGSVSFSGYGLYKYTRRQPQPEQAVVTLPLSPPAATEEPWLELFKEKQRLEEELASLEAQIPKARVVPAIKVGKDDVDLLREKIERKKKEIKQIEERMKRLTHD